MENTGKSSLHMVESNWDEIERKVREHKMKQIRLIAIIVAICVAAGIIYYVYMQHKSYDDYNITDQVTRTDTVATHFAEYNGNILKYSNDGVSCTTADNTLIWNQSFEMQDPMVSICEKYVAFADKQGKEIYVLNASGTQGKISVTMPILKIEVASQGTVAVLMEESGTSYLALYNKSGEQLAEGAIHVENGGTPMDIALSQDGKKLGVSILDISEGTAKTTVNFYNFGAVGQNKIDNIVATFSYPDTIIPEIAYVSADRMIAFADNGVYTFSGADTPKEGEHLALSEEINSIFYDNTYFGLVFTDNEEETNRNIKVYDMKCREVVSIQTGLSYNKIRFLDNHEICLYNEKQCTIYTLGGLQKFQYEFEDRLCEIIHTGGYRQYAFLLEGKTELVRLRLFGKAEETTEDKATTEDETEAEDQTTTENQVDSENQTTDDKTDTGDGGTSEADTEDKE